MGSACDAQGESRNSDGVKWKASKKICGKGTAAALAARAAAIGAVIVQFRRSCMRITLSAFGVLSVWSTRVDADPLELVKIALEAPAGCPDRSVLESILRRDLANSKISDLRLAVNIHVAKPSLDPPGIENWHAEIHLTSSGGESDRSLTARTCASLIDATSLVLATIIDPDAAGMRQLLEPTAGETASQESASHASLPTTETARPTAPNGERTAPAAAPPQTNQNNPVATATASRTRPLASTAPTLQVPANRDAKSTALQAHAALALAADVGSLPRITAAVRAMAGLSSRKWRGELRLGWWWPQQATLATNSTIPIGTFGLVAGDLRGCYWGWRIGRSTIAPCATVEVERWSGDGGSNLTNRHQVRLWGFSVGAGALGSLEISDVIALRADLDFLVPISRPMFGYSAAGHPVELFAPSRPLLRGGLGVEVHFL